MNILFLSPHTELIPFIESFGDTVVQSMDYCDMFPDEGIDFVISYGYRFILPEHFIKRYEGRIINMHVSYLPWNRGADPNLWSWIDNTPKGVTIHLMDKGIDTGMILAQTRTEHLFDVETDTLSTSYAKVADFADWFFRVVWENIQSGRLQKQKQVGQGSYHSVADRAKVEHLLTDGWNTKVKELIK